VLEDKLMPQPATFSPDGKTVYATTVGRSPCGLLSLNVETTLKGGLVKVRAAAQP
jgi:hypothetical protein